MFTCLNLIGLRLGAAVLVACFYFSSLQAEASDQPDDAFLVGYVASILERELLWERNSYAVKVVNGFATVTLFVEDPIRLEELDMKLGALDIIQGMKFVVKSAHTRSGPGSRFIGLTGGADSFPTGDLFRPLIADPKQPQFFVSFNRFESSGAQYTMASVGFGETLGFYKFYGSREGDGLQMSVVGGLFAQFNMSTPSYNLINADYTIGFPVTYRHGNNSLRLRLYHQSSHLGDEFLQDVNPPERVNLSYEAVELLYSLEWRWFRAYAGSEYLIHKEPKDLKPLSVHWGIEYRGNRSLVWDGRPICGVDVKSLDEHNWSNDTSVKAGLEFGHADLGRRRLLLMAEWYQGFDPHGQFYNNKVQYYGLGVSLGF
ncbi:MAG: DUF1207 domain-containing protein [Proteobacteria bacterium]|nr:DUF1207 domain-containing protein [Pseudomonadota bacterium]MBU1687108.1 DUF1207 domain-containing protein [Pseudomonadota bacterium]